MSNDGLFSVLHDEHTQQTQYVDKKRLHEFHLKL